MSVSLIDLPVPSQRLCHTVQQVAGQEIHLAARGSPPPPLAPKKTPAKRNKTNKNTRRENADSKPLPRNMTATAVKRWKLARKQIQMYMLTRTHTWTRGEGQSHSVGTVCLSVLSSCYEIRGEHQRNLLPGYKTEAAQGKNGNASMSGGRGLPGCNHSC